MQTSSNSEDERLANFSTEITLKHLEKLAKTRKSEAVASGLDEYFFLESGVADCFKMINLLERKRKHMPPKIEKLKETEEFHPRIPWTDIEVMKIVKYKYFLNEPYFLVLYNRKTKTSTTKNALGVVSQSVVAARNLNLLRSFISKE